MSEQANISISTWVNGEMLRIGVASLKSGGGSAEFDLNEKNVLLMVKYLLDGLAIMRDARSKSIETP